MKEWALKYLSKLFLEQDLVSLGNQTQKSAKNQFGWGTILLIRGRPDCRKKKISQSFPKCLQDGLVSSGYLAGCEKMEETEEQNTS